ncbi:MAG TPA: hypothetical protein VGR87_03555 [Candidatus Limnocylindria bacterium]|jgi:hypothetical protein|nr:hypothetical protein [Candidatus Limnocylindria bacterium]
MTTYSELREYVLDTLWSHWHELGVAAAVPRRHSDDFVDPEPLIAFTAAHSDLDPRLRDESIDWVLQYGPYVSKARLKNVASDWGLLENTLFREYAATVNAHGGTGWPSAGTRPLPFRSRARVNLEDLTRPALLSLRIRAIFGVGARAELMRAFLTRPLPAMTAADLAEETRYGKRNVLNELEPLRLARVVTSFRAVNVDRYSLAKADEIKALVRPLPQRFTRWIQTFAALHAILEVSRGAGKRSELQNAVEAARFLQEHKDLLASAELYPPALPAGVAAWRTFLDWAVAYARVIARK